MEWILKTEMEPRYDRNSQLKAFEDSKAGVKGLVDAGVAKLPRMFHHGNAISVGEAPASDDSQFTIPIIDLQGIHTNPSIRDEVITKARDACQRWGFFQVVNHGIPREDLNEMLCGVRMFHDQETEIKREYYSRDNRKKVLFYGSNFNLRQVPVADWRDSVACPTTPDPTKPEELPQVFREIVIKYTEQVMSLAITLTEILSEALGLKPSHLKEIGCAGGLSLAGHCYPLCPEPEYTLGTSSHTDFGFLNILLQDNIGGLQVLHQDQWINVPPIDGALVVNIGDLLQLVSNDSFRSVSHRVLANHSPTPRISVACFIGYQDRTGDGQSKVFGPIEELVSEAIPAVYKETTLKDFLSHYVSKVPGTPSLQHLKL